VQRSHQAGSPSSKQAPSEPSRSRVCPAAMPWPRRCSNDLSRTGSRFRQAASRTSSFDAASTDCAVSARSPPPRRFPRMPQGVRVRWSNTQPGGNRWSPSLTGLPKWQAHS
jgi:hypothetical protein